MKMVVKAQQLTDDCQDQGSPLGIQEILLTKACLAACIAGG
jgi:hypothetical protein